MLCGKKLHCLNSIRQIVYGTNKWYNPEDRQDQIHIDHCIDYLRQVLMCHSDVTAITHAPRPKPYNSILMPWRPNFAVTHTCRNFWQLHDWAGKRNSSGFVIETWPGTDPVAELREKPVEVWKWEEGRRWSVMRWTTTRWTGDSLLFLLFVDYFAEILMRKFECLADCWNSRLSPVAIKNINYLLNLFSLFLQRPRSPVWVRIVARYATLFEQVSSAAE